MLLAVGAMTPNAIAEHFNSSRQAISKHIRILAECEILTQEQQGREIHYHLKADKMNDIEAWLEEFKKLMSKRFDQLDVVLEQLKRNRK
ncbi:MAG: transcriptional regulator [Cytophagaceae bacterium SCN 52-12]|nr:MAG: transcriptional regulator [Cytophagaceae bacterium SCN 52-12]